MSIHIVTMHKSHTPKVQYSIRMVKKRRISVVCYKPIVLATPKILSIVNETFTPIPKEFMISVTG